MFFNFQQNNSGGVFKGPAVTVIIEADDSGEANARAEKNGLYFDGVEKGIDCSCCGDRWYPQWDDVEGTETPTSYGKEVEEDPAMYWGEAPTTVIIRK